MGTIASMHRGANVNTDLNLYVNKQSQGGSTKD